MNRTRTQTHSRPPKAAPELAAELEDARIVERPDGFWVQAAEGEHEIGPYASLVEAIEDQPAVGEEVEDIASGDTLAEVEAQIGVSDWIDPETLAPAEDSVPRIEEH